MSSERLEEVLSGLQEALDREMHATVVDKENDILHLSIAKAFDIARGTVEDVRALAAHLSIDVPELGLPSGQDYLTKFATTVGTVIAVPEKWTTEQRLLTLPHEWTHVWQHKRGVDAGWWPKAVSHSVLYLCSYTTKDAAEYLGKVEGDAYAVTECMRKFFSGGPLRPIEDVGASLRKHYALMNEGVIVADQVMQSHYATMDSGGIPNVTACRVAMDYLQSKAHDVQGTVTF